MKINKFILYLTYAVLLLIYIFLMFFAFSNIERFAKVGADAAQNVTVVIDAGHGGEDGGAVANGIIEKDINLSISRKLAALLSASGYKVREIRKTDVMVNTEGETTRERKVSDMKNRLAVFNENEGNIVISIHQNKFPQEKYNGTQVFYSTNNDNSAVLAESIRESVVSLIQPENERETKPAGKEIYLLHNAEIPAVIVECGFLSNYNEAKLLETEKYQQKIAFAIFAGFSEFYNNRG